MNDLNLIFQSFKFQKMAKSSSGGSFIGNLFRFIVLIFIFHLILSMSSKDDRFKRDTEFVKESFQQIQKSFK